MAVLEFHDESSLKSLMFNRIKASMQVDDVNKISGSLNKIKKDGDFWSRYRNHYNKKYYNYYTYIELSASTIVDMMFESLHEIFGGEVVLHENLSKISKPIEEVLLIKFITTEKSDNGEIIYTIYNFGHDTI